MPSYPKIVFLSMALLTPLAFSATNPTAPGTSSTGTVGVSITIPALVQISGLTDITIGTPTTFPVTGNTTACVYSNVVTPAGSYYITATSANQNAGTFRVNSTTTSTSFITYSAYWNNATAATQTTPLTSGTKSTTQQTGGNTTSLTCGGATNANFNISFSAAQIAGAAPATYTDTVTLLITPS